MTPTEQAAIIVRRVSRASGLPSIQIIGKRRSRGLPAARWACWLAMRECGHTFQVISEIFYAPDHSAIIKGVKRAMRLRESCPEYAAICAAGNFQITAK